MKKLLILVNLADRLNSRVMLYYKYEINNIFKQISSQLSMNDKQLIALMIEIQNDYVRHNLSVEYFQKVDAFKELLQKRGLFDLANKSEAFHKLIGSTYAGTIDTDNSVRKELEHFLDILLQNLRKKKAA